MTYTTKRFNHNLTGTTFDTTWSEKFKFIKYERTDKMYFKK